MEVARKSVERKCRYGRRNEKHASKKTEAVDQEQVDTQEPTVSVSELQRRLDKQ